jgi:hypothetical protein
LKQYIQVVDTKSFNGSKSLHISAKPFPGGEDQSTRGWQKFITYPLPLGVDRLFIKFRMMLSSPLEIKKESDGYLTFFGWDIKSEFDQSDNYLDVIFGQIRRDLRIRVNYQDAGKAFSGYSPLLDSNGDNSLVAANSWGCWIIEANGQSDYDALKIKVNNQLIAEISSPDHLLEGEIASPAWLLNRMRNFYVGMIDANGDKEMWLDEIVISKDEITCQ